MRKLALLLFVLLLAVAAAGCGSDDDEDNGASATTEATTGGGAEDACAKDSLDLVEAGKLTIGTDNPAFPPWFEGGTPEGSSWEINDPATGEGFESAVAYAVAEKLGFTKDEVKWIVVPFNSSYAPGPKKFDFDINQISINAKRAKRVDFSEPYFTAPQAVIALKGSSADGAKSLADLAKAKLGVQVGTTSLDAVTEKIKPSDQPQVFNDSNDTVRALKNKRVDGIVVDLPTAFYLTAAEIDDSVIVGQFDAPGGDDWGLLAEKGSELTPCLNKAITELKDAGELQRIQDEWMSGDAAPKLS
jgi:polar amino acid transport system substrate-binding protein